MTTTGMTTPASTTSPTVVGADPAPSAPDVTGVGVPHGQRTNEVFRQTFTFTDGYLHPGDEPGIGVELDTGLTASLPYLPAYLPFDRLKDGTVHDW
ncbi:MAG: hypothetical protein ABI181_08835 [Mycobacteriaceae bacterium]